MWQNKTHKILTICIALIWLVNGLFCKVLQLVPRHQEIVDRILNTNYTQPITIAIGVAEIFMAIWIISGYKSKINAIVQVLIIGVMNILEFALAQDLLLWGKYNMVFALLLICVILYSEFYLKNHKNELT